MCDFSFYSNRCIVCVSRVAGKRTTGCVVQRRYEYCDVAGVGARTVVAPCMGAFRKNSTNGKGKKTLFYLLQIFINIFSFH